MSLPTMLGEALRLARGRIDNVDAKVLLREASGCSAAALIGFPERELLPEAAVRYVDWVLRREAGEPVAHLTGCREFYGHLFRVTADTLIPRPDTELLVELTLQFLARERRFTASVATPSPSFSSVERLGERGQQSVGADVQNVGGAVDPSPLGGGWAGRAGRGGVSQESPMLPKVLDLGTGTGAIAISIALASNASVTAVEASGAALVVAQENAHRLSAQLRCLHGSWFEPVADERFDLIVSNPPYIAADDEHLARGDVRFEPPSALVAGADGLDDIRHIVAEAQAHLNPDGWLLLEHGYDQAQAVRDLLSASGLIQVQSWKDLAGIERVSGGQLAY